MNLRNIHSHLAIARLGGGPLQVFWREIHGWTDGPMNDVSESWMIAILFVDLVWSSDFKVLLLVLLLLSLVVVVSKKTVRIKNTSVSDPCETVLGC